MQGWKQGLMAGAMLCILACGAGCGIRSDQQAVDAGQAATGAAVHVDGSEAAGAVRHQLEVLVQNASKWRKSGDGKDNDTTDVRYMVTDLDHNGRLEILAEEDYHGENDTGKQDSPGCYEVDLSGDGIAAIDTDLAGENFLDNLETFSETAYYDPEDGEYHYVVNEYDDEYDGEDWEDWENQKNLKNTAFTLKDGRISRDTLGGQAADTVYSRCGKRSVRFSGFQFCHSLEEMTEEQVYHALENSYREFCVCQGYLLEKKEMKVYHHEMAIPQYTGMQDSGKQKRINQMISDWVKQGLGSYYDLQNPELEFSHWNITVKYAGRDRASLLLEMAGYAAGSAHANEYCDTLTLDLEQEKILTGEDLLTKEDREWIEDAIWDGDCKAFHGGVDYWRNTKKKGELFQTMASQGWQDAKIYQTRDDVGVVIPLREQGLDAYVYYEVWDWEDSGAIAYSNVDWEAYRYQLLASEYRRLQDYMPVLTGETGFSFAWWGEETKDGYAMATGNKVSMSQLFKQLGKEIFDESYLAPEDYGLCDIAFSDLTRDGKMELVLHFITGGGFYLILHQEGEQFYGTWFGEREFQGMQTDGGYVGAGGAYCNYYYRMRFEDGAFASELIGRQDGEDYYIQGEKVSEEEFGKWDESVRDEPACWYAPEALQEKGEEG